MEMHQIRYFLMLAETLNFTRAAEQCHVSQPALTRAIKLLEEELGGLLFSRIAIIALAAVVGARLAASPASACLFCCCRSLPLY